LTSQHCVQNDKGTAFCRRRWMFKSKAFLVFCGLFLCCTPAWGQGAPETERLYSSSVSKIFYETAYELAYQGDVTTAEADQAIIFLTAALDLDSNADDIIPVLIKLTCQHSQQDRSALVYHLLTNYVDESENIDLEPARTAIRYLLSQLNSREEREKLLIDLLKNHGGKNAVLGSELSASLGLLIAETPDLQSAQTYLIQAYYKNKYNKLAFAKLAALMPKQIGPAMYLEHLRLALIENPTDLEAALKFAQYAEQLQLYEVAAGAYEYCSALFKFLYPSQPLS